MNTPREIPLRVLSLLSADEAQRLNGLPVEAIAGAIAEGDELRPETFQVNPRFVQFMHEVLREAGPLDPRLQAEARSQGNGWVFIIDLRTYRGSEDRIPPEDIIGGFEARDGAIVPSSYSPNDRYRVLTALGLVTLPPGLRAAFVARLTPVPPSA